MTHSPEQVEELSSDLKDSSESGENYRSLSATVTIDKQIL